jgi:hypothetical protein
MPYNLSWVFEDLVNQPLELEALVNQPHWSLRLVELLELEPQNLVCFCDCWGKFQVIWLVFLFFSLGVCREGRQ